MDEYSHIGFMGCTFINNIYTGKELEMEITDKIVLREADTTTKDDNLPERVRVRACTKVAKWKNISIERCENEGNLYVGLSCQDSSVGYVDSDIAVQIRIEDIPVFLEKVKQMYNIQVIKEHKRKWSNYND